jgi:predicted amidohydrolase
MPSSRLAAAVLAALGAVLATRAAGASPEELRVAAVQLSISSADLASTAAYVEHIQGAVRRCLPFDPDLILFPEYTSAFLAVLPYGGRIGEAGTLEEALRRALAQEPLARDLRDLFLLNSGLAERDLRELFGGLARRYGLAIGAGSWFAAVPDGGRITLVNRAVIFDDRGVELYSQDKVFLTPFEEELLGLRPGRLEAARPFLLQGRRVALTLCRDTYFREWEPRFRNADLWVDLQANGEPYTDEVRERYRRALPARLPGAGVPYGLTLCLTGGLAGLVWAGQSSVVRWQLDRGDQVLARASSPTGEDILFFTLPAPEAETAAEGTVLPQ